jgi:penicillin V acylase-like amidase (Ntn superfamily)
MPMTNPHRIVKGFVAIAITLVLFRPVPSNACSTFKLQKGDVLLYGHNLNQPGMQVPGLVFINKRGVFKVGRSWPEMITPDRRDPSTLSWISRYGSVTFSTFGRDMPDGGMNEAGVYIWEMGDDVDYPKNPALPKLVQMNWMQYVLDNCADLDEALATLDEVEIGGWGWHYFVGDGRGDCAAIDFIQGQTVIHRGASLPVPGLFNEPYAREVELMHYFKGFGGLYEPDLGDRKVPRFVKTAVLIRDFDPARDRDAAAYGLMMLERLYVNEPAKWSVLIDARRRVVYFKTELNPAVKTFSMEAFDFADATPALVLNMDRKEGGDAAAQFHPADVPEIRTFIAALPLPDGFYREIGLSRSEFAERFATHHAAGADPARQSFKGIWETRTEAGQPEGGGTGAGSSSARGKGAEDKVELELTAAGDAVSGEIRNAKGERYSLDHIHLVAGRLSFTFRNQGGTIYIFKALIDGGRMSANLWGIDGLLRDLTLFKRSGVKS